jgi:hypothetical protein
MESEMSVDRLPHLRPAFIELKGDTFIRNPHWKDDEADVAGIDSLLAMTSTELLRWHEAWRQFIRQCERQGWTPEWIAATVWGATRIDEPC